LVGSHHRLYHNGGPFLLQAGLLPADDFVTSRLAKQAGFTLAEIRTLLRGFSPRTSPSKRWHVLARKKLPEVEALIARAHTMKRLLEEGLHCGCLRLEDCALLASGSGPSTESPSRASLARTNPRDAGVTPPGVTVPPAELLRSSRPPKRMRGVSRISLKPGAKA